MGHLDQAAIDRVRDEVWPEPRNSDELHDALVELGFVTAEEGTEWQQFFAELNNERRAAVLTTGTVGGSPAMSAEREQSLLQEPSSMSAPDGAPAGETPAVPVRAS